MANSVVMTNKKPSPLDELFVQDAQGPSIFSKVVLFTLVVLVCVSLTITITTGIIVCSVPVFTYNSEWEGAQFIAAVRLLEGQPIYPLYEKYGDVTHYPPLTVILFYLGMSLFGKTILVPKIMAFAAAILSFVGIVRATFLFTNSQLCALVSAGFFATVHKWSALWYFNIRPDIFCSAFTIWGIIFALEASKNKDRAASFSFVATLFFTAAAYSKHNFVIFPLGYLIYCFYRHKRAAFFVNSLMFSFSTFLALLTFNTGENHLLSCLFFMGKNPLNLNLSLLGEFLEAFNSIALLLSLCLFSFLPKGTETLDPKMPREIQFWGLVISFIVGFFPYIKVGGGTNSFLTFSAIMSIVAAAGLKKVTLLFWPKSEKILSQFLVVPIVVILLMLPFHIYHLLIADRPGPVFYRVITYLKNYPGAVWVPQHNYLAFLAGKGVDVDDPHVWGRHLNGSPPPHEIVDKIERKYFSQIIGDLYELPEQYKPERTLKILLKKNYEKLEPSPLEGWSVWVPKREEDKM